MSAKKILCNLSDVNEVIKEAREEWIIEVLMSLGVSEQIIEMGFSSSGNDYEEYLYNMEQVGIEVDLFADGVVIVYKKSWCEGEREELSGWLPAQKKHIVAKWEEPERVKRIDKDKSIYYEVNIKEWHLK